MKGFTFFFSLYISSLLICNARPLSRRTSGEPVSTSGSHSPGLDIIRTDHIRPRSDQLQVPLTNNVKFRGATVDIQVGDTSYTVGFDTKLANTWIGANPSKPYLPSNSSVNTEQSFRVGYDFGSASGVEFIDVVELTGIPQNFTQSFGSANKSSDFNGLDGVLAVGLSTVSIGTLSPNGTEAIPTVPENMVKNNITQQNIVGIFIPPSATNISGSLDFGGGTPDEVLTSAVQFTPSTNASGTPSWALANVSITYGDGNQSVPILEGGICVLDSLSSFLSLPIPSFNKYTNLTGAVFDENTGFMRADDPTKLQNMALNIGGESYDFTADAQTWPRSLNNEIDGGANETFLVVANLTETNLDTLCSFGWPVFQRLFVMLDGDKNEIGLANTKFTSAVLNG